MEKGVLEKENFEVLQVISKHPFGASIDEITKELSTAMSRRTLQRRLAHLVEMGELVKQGTARATRYLVQLDNNSYSQIPISIEGKRIKKLVNSPLEERAPVSYQREFLDRYQPNKTYYLSEDLRAYLKKIGTQPDDDKAAGTFARKILDRLLIDLSWNSSRLEGNTYSLLETKHLILTGDAAEEKTIFETQMILNHKAAIEFLIESIEDVNFNKYTIFNLHALLSENLIANSKACGRVRNIAVGIGKTVYRPLDIPQLIEECLEEILSKAKLIKDPFEQSFFTMVHLPYLQAFEDVNKRVSRLCANIPLIRNNLCPISFIDVSKKDYIEAILGVYELNQTDLLKDLFKWAYERSCLRYSNIRHTLGEPDPFRLRYRSIISEKVREIVVNEMDETTATKTLQRWAKENIPENDRIKLIESVETELLDLHRGNIARFKIRPVEFEKWRKIWKAL